MSTTIERVPEVLLPETEALPVESEQVWHELESGSFAVISYATPSGEPRSSGVMYKAVGRRLYIVAAPDSWKAKHIVVTHNVAMTVPVRRGGLLSLVFPIPPATISFHGKATAHVGDSPWLRSVVEQLGDLLPAERRASSSVIEIVPEGWFVTYGIGVSLDDMRDPDKARARVPVGTSA
jgi:Pyridoxamine 5'-phosphate oxidase